MLFFGFQFLLSVRCMMVVILTCPYFFLTIFSEAEVTVGSAGTAGQLCRTVGMPLRGWDTPQAVATAVQCCQSGREWLLTTPGLSLPCCRLTKGAAVACFPWWQKILNLFYTHTQRLFTKEELEETAVGLSGVPHSHNGRWVGVLSASEGACSPFWILLNLPVL